MKRTYYNHYEESEVNDILDMLYQAQLSVGRCCEDQELKCLTCDKRRANYFIDQAKNIIKGRQEYTNIEL